MSGERTQKLFIILVLSCCALSIGAWAGGSWLDPCVPEEMHWGPKQWRDYIRKGQQAVHDAYAKAMDAENQRRESVMRRVSVIRPQKDAFGDPMYTTYGPRAYVGTPNYVGPRYASSFERPGRSLHFQTSARVSDPSVYVPGAPARSDVVLKPTAARPY